MTVLDCKTVEEVEKLCTSLDRTIKDCDNCVLSSNSKNESWALFCRNSCNPDVTERFQKRFEAATIINRKRKLEKLLK